MLLAIKCKVLYCNVSMYYKCECCTVNKFEKLKKKSKKKCNHISILKGSQEHLDSSQ